MQKGNRQLLQLVTSRRIYASENSAPTGTNEMKDSSQAPRVSYIGQSVNTTDSIVIHGDTNEQGEYNFDNQNNQDIKSTTDHPKNASPIEVQVRCIFLRVGDIDTQNEHYRAEILFEASWTDSKLLDLHRRPFNPMVDWTPRLELVNGIGELNDEITYSVRYNHDGVTTVTEHHKMKGILWERMELQHFPLDVQDLSISFTTSHSTKDMVFAKNSLKPSGADRRIFTDEQEWYLFEHVDIEVAERDEPYLDHGHTYSTVTCSCHAARRYGYFMWNSYFLIFLITSASFATFPIPLSNIFGRAQIACTLLLTSITFRWLSNRGLPTVSYLTAVDVYAIGSIFSLCTLNIYHGVIGYVNYYIAVNENISATTMTVHSIVIIDRWALVVYTILFFSYQFGVWAWMYFVPWKRRRTMFRKDKDNRLALASKYGSLKNNFFEALQMKTIRRKNRPAFLAKPHAGQS